MARRWGPIALGNEIQIVRSLFKHAIDAGILNKATLLGPGFKKPSAKTVRMVRAANGPKVFTQAELHVAIAKAEPTGTTQC
jgi:hypothetical protein